MMKNLLKFIFGLNLASLASPHFIKAAIRAFTAAHTTDTFTLSKIPVVPLKEKTHGALPQNQLLALLYLLKKHNPKVVLEIGTFMGHTTRAMSETLPDSIIHTIDLPLDYCPENKDDFHLIDNRDVGREFKGMPNIIQHFGDTATFDFSVAKDATFFFIDGSHTYEYCKIDTRICFDLCHFKGVFVWHDCDFAHPGVVQVLKEYRDVGYNIVRLEGTPLAYLDTVDK